MLQAWQRSGWQRSGWQRSGREGSFSVDAEWTSPTWATAFTDAVDAAFASESAGPFPQHPGCLLREPQF